jgi:hypothetical protein
MSIANLVSEVRAAEAVGDDPRRNRAVYALRLLFGVSIVEPCAKVHYGPYRPTDSDLASAMGVSNGY